MVPSMVIIYISMVKERVIFLDVYWGCRLSSMVINGEFIRMDSPILLEDEFYKSKDRFRS